MKTRKLNVNQLLSRAKTQHKKGNIEKAREAYTLIISKFPKNLNARKGLASLNQPISVSNLLNEEDIEKIKILFSSEKYQEAIDMAKEFLQIHQKSSILHNIIGVCYRKLNKPEQAITSYTTAIKVDPACFDAYNNLGNSYRDIGLVKKSEFNFRKAIELNPNYATAYDNLGNLLKDAGKFKQAITCFNNSIKIDPGYTESYNNKGNTLWDLGDIDGAKACYQQAIKSNTKSADAHNNMGAALNELGATKEAIQSYLRAIKINPSYVIPIINLGNAYQKIHKIDEAFNTYKQALHLNSNAAALSLSHLLRDNYVSFNSDTKNDFEKILIQLLQWENINHSNLYWNIEKVLPKELIRDILHKDEPILKQKLNFNEKNKMIFQLSLQKLTLKDPLIEKFLAQTRFEILEKRLETKTESFLLEPNFIFSLAEQCFLNEYIYTVSSREKELLLELKKTITSSDNINEVDIAIYSCYEPLYKSNILNINYISINPLFNDLVILQLTEPIEERKLATDIESLDLIENEVSQKVQAQYEENPYPRWRNTSVDQTAALTACEAVNNEIYPNKITKLDGQKTKVLIAGCGTGQQALYAQIYKNSDILAIDLSIASLAYAKRKHDELNLKNTKFLHADILQLGSLSDKFDVIECCGVLHHMENPEAGLKILLGLLKPNGFVKLALYSEDARRHIVAARKYIADQGYSTSNEDIRQCRKEILAMDEKSPIAIVKTSRDFYSTSSTRDLIFHEQEHRFTITSISSMLNRYRLEFLGFVMNKAIKKIYATNYPDDTKMVELNNWHKFEQLKPDTFRDMYQFWVRKN